MILLLLDAKGVNLFAETRDLAGRSAVMQCPSGYGPVNYRHGLLQGSLGFFNRLLFQGDPHLLYHALYPGSHGAVALSPYFTLFRPLDSRFVSGQLCSSSLAFLIERLGIYTWFRNRTIFAALTFCAAHGVMDDWRVKAEEATLGWPYSSYPTIPPFHRSSMPNLGPGPRGGV